MPEIKRLYYIYLLDFFRTYAGIKGIASAAFLVLMARSYAVLLLLLHYLLVVGAGLSERPARHIDRAFAYVHSQECQRLHTLRVACFDDCNGVQYKVQKNETHSPLHKLLTSFKGLDKHCLPERHEPMLGTLALPSTEPRLAAVAAAAVCGFSGQIFSPPRRG